METIIKSIIRDELISSKLLLTLDSIHIDTSCYQLNLSNTILKITGIELTDIEFETYDKMFEKVMDIDIEDVPSINKLTDKMYNYLIKLKNSNREQTS